MRQIGTNVKIASSVVLAVVLFLILTPICLARNCTCFTRYVEDYKLEHSIVGPMAVNAKTGRLYVVADDAVEVLVFDTRNLKQGPIARVPTLGYHGGIAVNEVTNKIYAPQGFDHHVRVIDGEAHAYHDIHIPGLENAMGDIAVDAERQRLYIARNDNFDIGVVDTATETYIGEIGEGCCPSKSVRLAVEPESGRLFIIDMEEGVITVLDAEGEKIGTLSAGDEPRDIAFDVVTGRAYVPNHESMNLTVFDLSEELPRAIHDYGSLTLPNKPHRMAIDPYARRGYLTNPVLNTSWISVIDLDNGRHVADVKVGIAPHWITLDPANARVFSSVNDGSISVVQGCGKLQVERPRPEATPPPPALPVGIELGSTPESERADYVQCVRMFRQRGHCAEGVKVLETELVRNAIEAEGASMFEDGAAGWWCGDGQDSVEIDFSAAGFYYSVPVLESESSNPEVWTFSSSTRTFDAQDAKMPSSASVERVLAPDESPWPGALWQLTRCKTKMLSPEECCG